MRDRRRTPAPRSSYLYLPVYTGFNRDGLGVRPRHILLAAWCAHAETSCQIRPELRPALFGGFGLFGHLSLLSLFKGPGTASLPIITRFKVGQYTGYFPSRDIIAVQSAVGYGVVPIRPNVTPKSQFVRLVPAALRKDVVGAFQAPSQIQVSLLRAKRLEKTVWPRGRPPRIP